MACYLPVTLGEIPEPDELGDEIGEERMVETIEDPGPENVHLEKDAFLSELVKLWISVEEASRDELIEDTDYKRWENGKEHVVEG